VARCPTTGTWETGAASQTILPMPTTDARLLLFSDAPRSAGPSPATGIRRYRLARLQPDAPRPATDEPRYAYLKRSYD
jgi:hypothetical protein